MCVPSELDGEEIQLGIEPHDQLAAPLGHGTGEPVGEGKQGDGHLGHWVLRLAAPEDGEGPHRCGPSRSQARGGGVPVSSLRRRRRS
jgi:hypothetical protein